MAQHWRSMMRTTKRSRSPYLLAGVYLAAFGAMTAASAMLVFNHRGATGLSGQSYAPGPRDIVIGAHGPEVVAFLSPTCEFCALWAHDDLNLVAGAASVGRLQLVLHDYARSRADISILASHDCESEAERRARFFSPDMQMSAMGRCAIVPAVRERIAKESLAETERYHIEGTPFFLVGGHGELGTQGAGKLLMEVESLKRAR